MMLTFSAGDLNMGIRYTDTGNQYRFSTFHHLVGTVNSIQQIWTNVT